jgi:Papain-like cysteine protease AvrRpt2
MDSQGRTVPQISQKETKWCWAACAQMVLQFYGKAVEQCSLAAQLFGYLGCCSEASSPLCNNPAQVPDIADVYTGNGYTATLINDSIPFEALQTEINANHPVEVGFDWNNNNGHQVLVCGWSIDSTGPLLLVNDPAYGSGAVYYVNLLVAYGWGSWRWTWTGLA